MNKEESIMHLSKISGCMADIYNEKDIEIIRNVMHEFNKFFFNMGKADGDNYDLLSKAFLRGENFIKSANKGELLKMYEQVRKKADALIKEINKA